MLCQVVAAREVAGQLVRIEGNLCDVRKTGFEDLLLVTTEGVVGVFQQGDHVALRTEKRIWFAFCTV